MEQPLLSRILAKIGIAILAVALADLLFVNYWLIKTENLKGEPVSENGIQLSRVIDPKSESSPLSLPSSSPSPTKSSSAQPSPIVKTETVIEKQTQTIIQTAQKELFIPIGSGFTKSNSYEDLAGLEVTIDTSKYSAIDSIVFEPKSQSKLEQVFEFLTFGSWVSFYLAMVYGRDPSPIPNVDFLKEEMAKD